MSKKKLLVDASVIANYLVLEKGVLLKSIKTMLLENDIFSSELLLFEIGNVIGKYYKNNLKVRLKKNKHIDLLSINKLNISFSEIQLAHKISALTNESFYDASYHAIAIAREMNFITFDKKYYLKAKDFGNIQLLK